MPQRQSRSGVLHQKACSVGYGRRVAEPRRFALYTRISKDPTGESTAPARQEKECRRLAEERGFKIVEVFSDADFSAYRDVRRPRYEAMLDGMAAGAFEGVLVWKLDRLLRRVVEFSRFWSVASAHDVALISKSDTLDTTNPIGLGIVYLLVALAEQESYNTSLRLRAKEREMAEQGRHKTAGRRAYGMRPGWVELEPGEADVIRDAAGRLLAGETIASIVRDLNGRGVPSATGGRWSRTALTVLMRQPRLWGWRAHNGDLTAAGDWPAILDEATGRKLRELLTPDGSGADTARRQHLLSGLLRCGKCTARMKGGSAAGAGGGRRYVCPGKVDGGCNGTVIDLGQTDEAVITMALYRLDTPGIAERLRERASTTDDAALLAELAGIRDRSKELATMWAAGELARASWLDAQRELDRRNEDLARTLAASQRAEPALRLVNADGITDTWHTMPTDRQRAVLASLIDHITVHGAGSDWYATRLRESLLAEADEAEAAGDKELARRRRRQAENRKGGGGSFRPERLEVVWTT